MRSLNEINNRHINIMMLMTYIRRTNTLLLIFFMRFIVKLSGNFYDDLPVWSGQNHWHFRYLYLNGWKPIKNENVFTLEILYSAARLILQIEYATPINPCVTKRLSLSR